MRALGVLGAVAALLAAYLLFFDHDPRERGVPASAALLGPLDRASARRLTISRAGEPPFALVQGADGTAWRLQPDDVAAAPGAVQDLLNALEQAESDRSADLPPGAAGLAPPRVTLSIESAGGPLELRLGKPDAGGSGVFVQAAAGGPVRVAPRRLLELIDRPASAWRDRARPASSPADGGTGGGGPAPAARSPKVLDFAHFDVRQLRRISRHGTLDARSTDGETWSSRPPVDPRVMARLVAALGNLQAAAWLLAAPPGRPDLSLEIAVQAPGDPAPVRHTVDVWPACVAEMKNAGAFRVAQNLCDDLRLDPASGARR